MTVLDTYSGEVVCRGHCAADGALASVEIIDAPDRTLITAKLLAHLDRDPADPDIVWLALGYRYRLGRLRGHQNMYEAERVPEPTG